MAKAFHHLRRLAVPLAVRAKEMNGGMMHISMVPEHGPDDKWAFAWNTILEHLACSPWLPNSCLSLHVFKLGCISTYSGLQHCECGYIRMHSSHVDIRKDLYGLPM